MKRLIGGKVYDTKTAAKVAEAILPPGGCGDGDWADKWRVEVLHRTSKGNYFLHGKGGENTRWATRDLLSGDGIGDGEGIMALTPEEVVRWLEDFGLCVPEGCPEIEAVVEMA